MSDIKEKAEAVFDAYYTCEFHNPSEALAVGIRELVFQLQYYQCCEESGVEDMVLDARAILDLCDELEKF